MSRAYSSGLRHMRKSCLQYEQCTLKIDIFRSVALLSKVCLIACLLFGSSSYFIPVTTLSCYTLLPLGQSRGGLSMLKAAAQQQIESGSSLENLGQLCAHSIIPFRPDKAQKWIQISKCMSPIVFFFFHFINNQACSHRARNMEPPQSFSMVLYSIMK